MNFILIRQLKIKTYNPFPKSEYKIIKKSMKLPLDADIHTGAAQAFLGGFPHNESGPQTIFLIKICFNADFRIR